MMNRYDSGKIVTPEMEKYILRIRYEGPYITGRPRMRRTVTRQLVLVDGNRMIKKTIFELDGTTKVFMVPFVANFLTWAEQRERLEKMFFDAWEKYHGKKLDMDCGPSAPPSNPWLQPAF